MKSFSLLLLVFLLSACVPSSGSIHEQDIQPSKLPDLGKAPELTNDIWINPPETLRLAELKGQVVLLEMWTFG